jgi:SAM-dependent methyltransferase
MTKIEKSEIVTESDSKYYQRMLDLEAMGMMGITSAEKYEREVGVVFDSNQGGFSSLPKDARVLDLACGRGDTSKLVHEKGYAVTGVDSSDIAVADAKERFAESGVDFQVGDMRNPPKTEGGYDAITCFGRSLAYFERYEEYIEALWNWYASLKNGGKVAIEWTEWSDGDRNGQWQSVGGTTVVTEPEFRISDQLTGESLSFVSHDVENFDYPGEQLGQPIERRWGGARVYVDQAGGKHATGNKDTLFVDLLRSRNFPLIKRMLEEAGFEGVKLVEAPEPLTPKGNPRTYKVFAVVAERASKGTVVGKARVSIESTLGR